MALHVLAYNLTRVINIMGVARADDPSLEHGTISVSRDHRQFGVRRKAWVAVNKNHRLLHAKMLPTLLNKVCHPTMDVLP